MLNVCLPVWRCLYIIVYSGRLFLVGRVKEFEVMVRIGTMGGPKCLRPGVTVHILVYSGRLFLVGGVEEFGVMVRIGIWEMDWGMTE